MDQVLKKQAFLILTDALFKSTLRLYQEIKRATAGYGDVFLIYHDKQNPLPAEAHALAIESFNDTLLTELHYKPIAQGLLPGSNHFPILKFYLEHREYSHYWCIENDVAYSGRWGDFFAKANSNPDFDFISSHIGTYADHPKWDWWKTFKSPNGSFSMENLYNSFNPIYRISNSAMNYIDLCLRRGYVGHHEVLFATLLTWAGFKLADFGNKDNHLTPVLCCCSLSSMRWKPIFFDIGNSANLLYHPVKAKITFKQFLSYVKRNLLRKTKYYD